MSGKKTGGQAYPRAGAQANAGWSRPTNGMTLLDYFAGQALAGLAGNSGLHDRLDYRQLASLSYDMADAMLEVRGE